MRGVRTKFYADIMSFHPEVTGSCNLVVVKYPDGTETKFVVDCGLFHEEEYLQYNKKLQFNPDNIDFVLVTHNHVDHIGRLPLLIKKGYNRKIYMTNVTQQLIGLALNDSYKVLKCVSKKQHEPELYSERDVENTVNKIVGCNYNEKIQVVPNIEVTFLSNGHLIGSAMIFIRISYPGYEDINILFTGDYNNKNVFFDVDPIPEEIKALPLTLIQESTYGDMDTCEIEGVFEQNIANALKEDKTVIVPVFSLGRSQEILHIIKKMQQRGEISTAIPIYLDGNLAIKYTNLYLKSDLGIKDDMKDFLPENLKYVDKVIRDELLNDNSLKVILTTSGMGSYGPAQLYIPMYISRKNALIHFTGFTAEGTLGNKLKNTSKDEVVNVAGLVRIKKADIEYTAEYSAHAKADEMIEFLQQFSNLKLVLLNHGETETKETFSKRLLREVDSKYVGVLGTEYLFRVNSYGLVKTMATKFK